MRFTSSVLLSLLLACASKDDEDTGGSTVFTSDDSETEPGDDLTEAGTCDDSVVGDCDVVTCCDLQDCYYIADGERFDCDGTDCEDAAADVVAFCN